MPTKGKKEKAYRVKNAPFETLSDNNNHVLDADHLQKLIHLAKKMLSTTQTEALGEAKVTFVFLLKKLLFIDYFLKFIKACKLVDPPTSHRPVPFLKVTNNRTKRQKGTSLTTWWWGLLRVLEDNTYVFSGPLFFLMTISLFS